MAFLLVLLSLGCASHMDPIKDGIYVGDHDAAQDYDALMKNNIHAVLNVAWDLDVQYTKPGGQSPQNYAFSGPPPDSHLLFQYHKVGLVDGPGNTKGSLAAAVLMLDQLMTHRDLDAKDADTFGASSNGPANILVHCHTGRSRSVTTVALYLHYKYPGEYKTFQQAVDFVKLRRNNHQSNWPTASMKALGNALAMVPLLADSKVWGAPQCSNYFPDPTDDSHYYPIPRMASLENFITNDDKYTFTINLCGPVECGASTEGVSVCQSWTDAGVTKYKNLGLTSTMHPSRYLGDVDGYDGGYTVQFDGGQVCHHNGRNRSTIVEVICSNTPEPVLEYLGEDDSVGCLYNFRLYAHDGACLTRKTSAPDVPQMQKFACENTYYPNPADHSVSYDVSALMQTYHTAATEEDGKVYSYTLGVCREVECAGSNTKHIIGCQKYTTDDNTQHARSMGSKDQASISPSLAGRDGFTMSFTGGDVCSHNNVPRTTMITVVCDPSADEPTLRYIDDEFGDCVYSFELIAREGACADGAPYNPTSSPPDPMTSSSTTGIVPRPPPTPPTPGAMMCGTGDVFYADDKEEDHYPISLLKVEDQKAAYSVNVDVDEDGKTRRYTYSVNICGPVYCGSHHKYGTPAVCQHWQDGGVDHYRALGISTTGEITDSIESPTRGYTVTYDQGEPCSHPPQSRRTIINVVCDPTVDTPRLTFDYESHCIYTFTLFAGEGACLTEGPPDNHDNGDASSGGHAGLIVFMLFLAFAVAGVAGTAFYAKKNPVFADQLQDVLDKVKCCGKKDPYSYHKTGGFAEDDL